MRHNLSLEAFLRIIGAIDGNSGADLLVVSKSNRRPGAATPPPPSSDIQSVASCDGNTLENNVSAPADLDTTAVPDRSSPRMTSDSKFPLSPEQEAEVRAAIAPQISKDKAAPKSPKAYNRASQGRRTTPKAPRSWNRLGSRRN
jgi:hypothetical protein